LHNFVVGDCTAVDLGTALGTALHHTMAFCWLPVANAYMLVCQQSVGKGAAVVARSMWPLPHDTPFIGSRPISLSRQCLLISA
jgi:hypothetical protein